MASSIIRAIAAAAFAALVIFAVKFRANRQHVRRLQAAGVPMPPHHPIFGHFIALKESIQTLPRNTTIHVTIRRISAQFPGGVFYLDLWPFNKGFLVVTDPGAAAQVETAFLDKPKGMCDTLEVINGGPSLMTMHGADWKRWRGLFNPGFAAGYMTGLAPVIVQEMAVFCGLLKDLSKKGEMIQLEEYTLRLTFDVISRVTLDARLRYQTQGSALADCLRRQVYWTQFGTTFNPFKRWLSPRPLVQTYNSWRMNRYLDGEIDKRFDELAASRRSEAKTSSPSSKSRSIISLAMDKYLADVGETSALNRQTFKTLVKPQLRMFLFAGHDTTSSTLLYCFNLLSQHPKILSQIRSEHDQVFGPDASVENLTQTIDRDPTLLNQTPYTLAFIKEVLRLFPPAGSMRDGNPNFNLKDAEGRTLPTDGTQIWTLSLAMHHSPQTFIRPEEFLPSRWLVGPDDALYPKKGHWRAFEWGARACIGQTLAVLELKVALVMVVRLFEIAPAYAEWDRLHPRKGIRDIDGNRMYQSEMGGGGAHPADGFPVRVSLRG